MVGSLLLDCAPPGLNLDLTAQGQTARHALPDAFGLLVERLLHLRCRKGNRHGFVVQQAIQSNLRLVVREVPIGGTDHGAPSADRLQQVSLAVEARGAPGQFFLDLCKHRICSS